MLVNSSTWWGIKTSLFKLPLGLPVLLLGGWWVGGRPCSTKALLAQHPATAIWTPLTMCCTEATCRPPEMLSREVSTLKNLGGTCLMAWLNVA